MNISLYGLAGIIEFSCGLAIALGFLTRLAAIITAIVGHGDGNVVRILHVFFRDAFSVYLRLLKW